MVLKNKNTIIGEIEVYSTPRKKNVFQHGQLSPVDEINILEGILHERVEIGMGDSFIIEEEEDNLSISIHDYFHTDSGTRIYFSVNK